MDEMRCQYASKPCDKTRTFKDNGTLHRLCAYHRVRANDAQRRWHSRQKDTSNATSTASDAQSSTKAQPVRPKRRRSVPAIKTENASGSEIVTTPQRRRRTTLSTRARSTKNIARMRVPLAPLWPAHFAGFVASPPQLCGNGYIENGSVISDHELAQLGNFIGELDEVRLDTDVGATSFFSADLTFEKEWSCATQYPVETTVYCV